MSRVSPHPQAGMRPAGRQNSRAQGGHSASPPSQEARRLATRHARLNQKAFDVRHHHPTGPPSACRTGRRGEATSGTHACTRQIRRQLRQPELRQRQRPTARSRRDARRSGDSHKLRPTECLVGRRRGWESHAPVLGHFRPPGTAVFGPSDASGFRVHRLSRPGSFSSRRSLTP